MGNVATAVKAEAINSLAINAGKDFRVPMRSVPSGRDLQKISVKKTQLVL